MMPAHSVRGARLSTWNPHPRCDLPTYRPNRWPRAPACIGVHGCSSSREGFWARSPSPGKGGDYGAGYEVRAINRRITDKLRYLSICTLSNKTPRHARTSSGARSSSTRFIMVTDGLRSEAILSTSKMTTSPRHRRLCRLVSLRGRPGDDVRGRYGGLGGVSGRGGFRVSVRTRERDRQLEGLPPGL